MKSKEQRLQDIENEARKLREEIEAEKNAPWEPKGGDWLASLAGNANKQYATCEWTNDWMDRGVLFSSREAAKAGAKRMRFYNRLCKMAEEFNPSGEVGGDYRVEEWEGWLPEVADYQAPDSVFETEEAAAKACEILNKEGAKLPWQE